MNTKIVKGEVPAPQHMLYRVTVTRKVIETREMIVYGNDESEALDYATENVDFGRGSSEFVLWDSDWVDDDARDDTDVEYLEHELIDYASEIADLNLDAKIAASVAAGVV